MELFHNNNTHIIFGCFSVLALILYKIGIDIYISKKEEKNPVENPPLIKDKERTNFKYLIFILFFSFVSEIFVFFAVYKNYKLINIEDIINTYILNFKNYISVEEKIKKICLFHKKNNVFIYDTKKIANINDFMTFNETFSKSFYDINKKETSTHNFYYPLNKEQIEINNTHTNHVYFEKNNTKIKINSNSNIYLNHNIIIEKKKTLEFEGIWNICLYLINNNEYMNVLNNLKQMNNPDSNYYSETKNYQKYKRNLFIIQTYIVNRPFKDLPIKIQECYNNFEKDNHMKKHYFNSENYISKMESFRLIIDGKEYITFGLFNEYFKDFIESFMKYLGISGNPEDDIFGDYILNQDKLYVRSYMTINQTQDDNKLYPASFYDNEKLKQYTYYFKYDFDNVGKNYFSKIDGVNVNNINYYITNIFNSNNDKIKDSIIYFIKKQSYKDYIKYLKNSKYELYEIINIYLINTPYNKLDNNIRAIVDEIEKENNNIINDKYDNYISEDKIKNVITFLKDDIKYKYLNPELWVIELYTNDIVSIKINEHFVNNNFLNEIKMKLVDSNIILLLTFVSAFIIYFIFNLVYILKNKKYIIFASISLLIALLIIFQLFILVKNSEKWGSSNNGTYLLNKALKKC